MYPSAVYVCVRKRTRKTMQRNMTQGANTYYVQNERARQTLRHHVQKAVLRKLLLATRWIRAYIIICITRARDATLLGSVLYFFFSYFFVRIACTFPHKSGNINVLHDTYQIAMQNIRIYGVSP